MSAPIAVLISGSGSNLRRILEWEEARVASFRVALVLSDRADAGGLEWAAKFGVPTQVVRWSDYIDRAAFTTAVCDAIDAAGCRYVVLAGFMRILSTEAVQRFSDRIVNVHPSLLPSFPGAHAVEDALAAGVKVTGVSIHFVTEEVDAGPVIIQQAVAVEAGDDAASLHARIQAAEHELYPQVVEALAAGCLAVTEEGVIWIE